MVKQTVGSSSRRTHSKPGPSLAVLHAAVLQEQLCSQYALPSSSSKQAACGRADGVGEAQRLTAGQWADALQRCKARRDFHGGCPICCEKFRDEPQVVIQAWVRRYLSRVRYLAILRAAPPPASCEHGRRRRWCADMLQDGGDRMLRALSAEHADLDSLFREMDAGVVQAQQACAKVPLSRVLAPSTVDDSGSRATGGHPSSTALDEDRDNHAGASDHRQPPPPPLLGWDLEDLDESRWACVVEAALARDARDCAICLNPCRGTGTGGDEALPGGGDDAVTGRGGGGHVGMGGADGKADAKHSCSVAAIPGDGCSMPVADELVCRLGQEGEGPPCSSSGGGAGGSGGGSNGGNGGGDGGGSGETHCDIPDAQGAAWNRGAGIAWLSCSHVFHERCIAVFEGFELARGCQPTCPCCRAAYVRRTLNP